MRKLELAAKEIFGKEEQQQESEEECEKDSEDDSNDSGKEDEKVKQNVIKCDYGCWGKMDEKMKH